MVRKRSKDGGGRSSAKRSAGSSASLETPPLSRGTAGALAGGSTWNPRNKYEIGTYVEARDNLQKWYPAKVVDVDDNGGDSRVRIHFLKWSKVYDEWISVNSENLRLLPKEAAEEHMKKVKMVFSPTAQVGFYKEGEVVLASWLDKKRYPAKVLSILERNEDPEEQKYHLKFHDGFLLDVVGKDMRPMDPAKAKNVVFSEVAILREEKKFMYTEPSVEDVPSREQRRQKSKKIDLKQVLGLKRKTASPSTSVSSTVQTPGDGIDEERPVTPPQATEESSERSGTSTAGKSDGRTGRRALKRTARYSPTPPSMAAANVAGTTTGSRSKPIRKMGKFARRSESSEDVGVDDPAEKPKAGFSQVAIGVFQLVPAPRPAPPAEEVPAEPEAIGSPPMENFGEEYSSERADHEMEEPAKTTEDDGDEVIVEATATQPMLEPEEEVSASSAEVSSAEALDNSSCVPLTDVTPERAAHDVEVASGIVHDSSAAAEDEPQVPESVVQSEEPVDNVDAYHVVDFENLDIAPAEVSDFVDGGGSITEGLDLNEIVSDQPLKIASMEPVPSDIFPAESVAGEPPAVSEEVAAGVEREPVFDVVQEEPMETKEKLKGKAFEQPRNQSGETPSTPAFVVASAPLRDPSFIPAVISLRVPESTLDAGRSTESGDAQPSVVPVPTPPPPPATTPSIFVPAPVKASHPSVLVAFRPSLSSGDEWVIKPPVARTPVSAGKKLPKPRSSRHSLPSSSGTPTSAAAAAGTSSSSSPAAPSGTTPKDGGIFALPPDEVLYENRCPLDNCRKIFRRPHLLQMHVKHYHPEYEHLVSVPSVIALAQNRTDAAAVVGRAPEDAGIGAESAESVLLHHAPSVAAAATGTGLGEVDAKTFKQTIAELEALKKSKMAEEERAAIEKSTAIVPVPRPAAPLLPSAETSTDEPAAAPKKRRKKAHVGLFSGKRRKTGKTPIAARRVQHEPTRPPPTKVALSTDSFEGDRVMEVSVRREEPASMLLATTSTAAGAGVGRDVEDGAAGTEPAPAVSPTMAAPPRTVATMILRTSKKKGAGWYVNQQSASSPLTPTTPSPSPFSAPLLPPPPPPPPPSPATATTHMAPTVAALTKQDELSVRAAAAAAATATATMTMTTSTPTPTPTPTPTTPLLMGSAKTRSAASSSHFGDDVSSSDAWGEDSAAEGDGAASPSAAFDVICCSCRSTRNEGLMIQCDTCMTWQHGFCENLDETAVPDKYECETCRNPRLQRPLMKYVHDQKYLKTGVLPRFALLEDTSDDEEQVASRRRLHELLAHLLNIGAMFPSLEHKINIARNINHPKLVQWAKSWVAAPPPPQLDVSMEDAAASQHMGVHADVGASPSHAAFDPAKLSLEEVRNIARLLESTILQQSGGIGGDADQSSAEAAVPATEHAPAFDVAQHDEGHSAAASLDDVLGPQEPPLQPPPPLGSSAADEAAAAAVATLDREMMEVDEDVVESQDHVSVVSQEVAEAVMAADNAAGPELALASHFTDWIVGSDSAAHPSGSMLDIPSLLPPLPAVPEFKAPELKRIEPHECQMNLLVHVEDMQAKVGAELDHAEEQLNEIEKKLAVPDIRPEARRALMDFMAKFILVDDVEDAGDE